MFEWKGTGKEVVRTINAGIYWFKNYEDEINSLNVFPVPDGDTGKNMKNTLNAIKKPLFKTRKEPVNAVLAAAAQGSLMGAKGCSGIIVSLLFQGFAEELSGKDSLTINDFTKAVRSASLKAWQGISNPVGGTILSIADAAANSAENSLKNNRDFLATFENILIDSRKALEKTTSQLAVLKKANVIDAGGLGLVYFIEGMTRYIKGLPVTRNKVNRRKITGAKIEFTSETQFCTEFVLEGDLTIDSIKNALGSMGDSLIIGRDGHGVFKVHIHTNDPDAVLETAGKSGKPLKIKIDDMKEQHRDFLRLNDEKNSAGN